MGRSGVIYLLSGALCRLSHCVLFTAGLILGFDGIPILEGRSLTNLQLSGNLRNSLFSETLLLPIQPIQPIQLYSTCFACVINKHFFRKHYDKEGTQKAFLTKDALGQEYLCYLVSGNFLTMVRLERANNTKTPELIVGAITYIAACDAVPVPVRFWKVTIIFWEKDEFCSDFFLFLKNRLFVFGSSIIRVRFFKLN